MIYTYKNLANITSWVMLLLIAGFVIRALAWHRKLSQKGDIPLNNTQWTTKDSKFSPSNSKKSFN